MSIGIITSPVTWALGTVFTPLWAQTVQDNINGLQNGTGPTLKALKVDGTGGAASSQPSGTVGVSGSGTGTSTPTPTIARGNLYKEQIAFAGAIYDGTVTTFGAGFNIQSVTRSSAGVYVFTFVTAGSSTAQMCPALGVFSLSNVIANITAMTTSSVTVTCKSTGGVATDCSVNLVVYHL